MTSSAPSVVSVVLAWNHLSDTLECLDTLRNAAYNNLCTILVDNGSTDGTHEAIATAYPAVRVVRIESNIGIARGYNAGMVEAIRLRPDYILLLNNDTALDPGMIGHLVTALERFPQAGMAMPKIFHYFGDPSRLWCTGAKWRAFPPRVKMMGVNARDGTAYSSVREIEFAPSCCLLVRRKVLDETGGFDPGYHFYYDDWDLSIRVRQAGHKILFVPQAHLRHKVSVSTQRSAASGYWWRVMGRSSVRFYLRHKRRRDLIVHTVWCALRDLMRLQPVRAVSHTRGVIEALWS